MREEFTYTHNMMRIYKSTQTYIDEAYCVRKGGQPPPPTQPKGLHMYEEISFEITHIREFCACLPYYLGGSYDHVES
jgi:hypothetical protein